MKGTENPTKKLDGRGTPHAWKVRVLRTLTKKQQDCLRLALYYFEHIPVDDKESLVEGIEVPLYGMYDFEMFQLKTKSEKARISIRLVRIPDAEPIAAGDVTEVEHGIH